MMIEQEKLKGVLSDEIVRKCLPELVAEARTARAQNGSLKSRTELSWEKEIEKDPSLGKEIKKLAAKRADKLMALAPSLPPPQMVSSELFDERRATVKVMNKHFQKMDTDAKVIIERQLTGILEERLGIPERGRRQTYACLAGIFDELFSELLKDDYPKGFRPQVEGDSYAVALVIRHYERITGLQATTTQWGATHEGKTSGLFQYFLHTFHKDLGLPERDDYKRMIEAGRVIINDLESRFPLKGNPLRFVYS